MQRLLVCLAIAMALLVPPCWAETQDVTPPPAGQQVGAMPAAPAQIGQLPPAPPADPTPGTTTIGFTWKGEHNMPPANPETGWAYRDLSQGASYYWDGSTWQVMAKDGTPGAPGINGTPGAPGNPGTPGTNGTNGTGITWKGELNTPPANPQTGWAYYNTALKKSYLWDGVCWSVIAKDGTTTTIVKPGQPGRSGRDGQITVRTILVNERGHMAAYQEVKSWNPASCSYVDARDELMLYLAKQYTDTEISKLKTNQNPPTDDAKKDEDQKAAGIPWWLSTILWLIGLFLLFLFLYSLFSRLYDWWNRRRITLSNTMGGKFFGINQPLSRVVGRKSGRAAIKKRKGYYLISACAPGGSYTFAPESGEIDLGVYDTGDEFEFILQVFNPRYTDMSADQDITDVIEVENGRIVPGSGYVCYGSTKIRNLSDDELRQITSGNPFNLRRLVACIPARDASGPGAINIVYRVQSWGGDGGSEDVETPRAGGGDESEPSEDTGVSKEEMLRLRDEARQKREEARKKAEADKAKADATPAPAPAPPTPPAPVDTDKPLVVEVPVESEEEKRRKAEAAAAEAAEEAKRKKAEEDEAARKKAAEDAEAQRLADEEAARKKAAADSADAEVVDVSTTPPAAAGKGKDDTTPPADDAAQEDGAPKKGTTVKRQRKPKQQRDMPSFD